MIRLSPSIRPLFALVIAIAVGAQTARAQAPAHPNPHAFFDRLVLLNRPDIRKLPEPLKHRLGEHGRAPAHLSADAGLRRSRQAEPAVPVLPARHERLRAERLHHASFPGVNDQAHAHRHRRPTAGCRRSARCAWCSSPSRACRPIPTTSARFIDVFTDISGPVRDQQRERLVRGLDDPRPDVPGRRAAAPRRPRAVRHAHAATPLRCARMGSGQQRPGRRSSRRTARQSHFPSAQRPFPRLQTNSCRSS